MQSFEMSHSYMKPKMTEAMLKYVIYAGIWNCEELYGSYTLYLN